MATVQQLRTALAEQYPGTEARINKGVTATLKAELVRPRASLHSEIPALFASNKLRHDSLVEIGWLLIKVP